MEIKVAQKLVFLVTAGLGLFNGSCLSPVSAQKATISETLKTKADGRILLVDSEVKALKPDGGMQMWYYRCPRIFRYPIPTNFEFAYIDKTGRVVISGPFRVANSFSHGAAVVSLGTYRYKDGSWQNGDLSYNYGMGQKAILSTDGNATVLTQGFDITEQFFDDLAVININRTLPGSHAPELHCELADKSGKAVTDFKWSAAKMYSEGLVAVIADDKMNEHMPVPLVGTMWGYRDKTGKTVIAPKFLSPGRFSEGLAAITKAPTAIRGHRPNEPAFYHGEEYAYIDKTGNESIQGPFMEAGPFTNGFACVMKDGKYGYIDKSGALVVPCQYDWGGDFSGKLAPVEKDMLVGYIDTTGKVVIDFKFNDGREFGDGLAPATTDGKHWGYVDESGKFAIEPKFQRAFPFNSGRALVYVEPQKQIVPSAENAQFFLFSAIDDRSSGHINNARKACQAVVNAAPNTKACARAKILLSCALPTHDLDPKVENLYRQGMNLVNMGKLDEAEKALKEAMAMDPGFSMPVGSRCYIYQEQKRYDDAIALLTKTLEKNPSYARGYWWLSRIYSAKGQKNLSEENLAKARSLDPDDPYFSQ